MYVNIMYIILLSCGECVFVYICTYVGVIYIYPSKGAYPTMQGVANSMLLLLWHSYRLIRLHLYALICVKEVLALLAQLTPPQSRLYLAMRNI